MFLRSLSPGINTYPSVSSTPTTEQKQFVVCPIPVGNTLSLSNELTTVLFPLLVRPKNTTYEVIMTSLHKNSYSLPSCDHVTICLQCLYFSL